MPIITPRSSTDTITVKTMPNSTIQRRPDWWNAGSKNELAEQMLASVQYLTDFSQQCYTQAALYARMYSNSPLYGFAGTNFTSLHTNHQMPADRPTMSVVTSCIDTLISRITQSRPRPIFLTDNSDYRQRNLAKQMNTFINGELYQTKAHELGPLILRDACIFGTGCIKVLEDQEKKISLERRLKTELLVDPNDSYYGKPRQIFEKKLVDRYVLMDMFPKYAGDIEKAQQAYPNTGGEASRTISDLVMVAEAWHLPSGPDATDGLHAIVCSEGVLMDKKWTKKFFPYVFQHYTPPLVGNWGEALVALLFGPQMEINKLLITISQSINLVGVPRVFVEDGSKVVKAHLNSSVGSIVTYRGTKPEYSVAPCVPREMYEQLQRLIDYAYQVSGISQLAASSLKPAGVTSGRALREYDDLQSDRFAALSKSYDNMYVDLAYQIIDKAIDIAERDGEYQTVYPNKDGTKEINLPDIGKLKDDPFVIQCYDASSLPRDPAGRLQTVIEMMQSGLVTPEAGRRLLDFPDIQQEEKLAHAAEERILQILDEIVEKGKFTPPDPFMSMELATTKVVQYYNLYMSAKLSEDRAEMLRNFFAQLAGMQADAMPEQPMAQPGQDPLQPQARPELPETSDMIPNVPEQGQGGMAA
jgi:hypothetical protein